MEIKARTGQPIIVGAGAQAHPEALGLLAEAASLVDLPTSPTEGEVVVANPDLGRIIGRSGCVVAPKTTINGPALFAKRAGRSIYSRVVRAEGPEVSTFVLITGFHGGAWRLYTGFAGVPAPREPHDRAFLAKALSHPEWAHAMNFWCRNALVYDPATCGPVVEMTWAEAIQHAAKEGGYCL